MRALRLPRIAGACLCAHQRLNGALLAACVCAHAHSLCQVHNRCALTDARASADPGAEGNAAAKGADTKGADAEAAVGNAGDSAKADVFKDVLGDLKSDAPKGSFENK